MKTVGIITEYNPFHNGHSYHLETAKEASGADYCIVVMSGNFVQRGEPAILDKYARTRMALACGADLVLELPVPYAVGSAEFFAAGAVSLMNELRIVDTICFGSESGDIAALKRATHIISQEPALYRKVLKDELALGTGFPAARQKALEEFLLHCGQTTADAHSTTALLNSPNNILGIEYLKALYRLKSSIVPLTITRKGGGYHQTSLDAIFSSATSIRSVIKAASHLIRAKGIPAEHLLSLKAQMPREAFQILEDSFETTCPVISDDFSEILHYRLLQIKSPDELTVFMDVSKDLADRIFNAIFTYRDFESFVDQIKVKNMTEGRICRSLFHILLDIRTEDVMQYTHSNWHHYFRVLGFRKNSTSLLSAIKNNASLPLITKLADAKQLLDREGMAMLERDIFASHVYQSIVTIKFAGEPYNEYSRQLVIL